MADLPEPASRKEEFLATAAGATGIELPEPASREELYLKAIAEGGGGGGGYVLPTASASTLGGVKVGSNLSIDGSGVLSAQTSVPVASANTLGGVKVGENLSIDANGVLSATGGGGGAITELTAADYNYPVNNPQYIALWLLPEGLYHINDTNNVQAKFSTTSWAGAVGATYLITTEPGNEQSYRTIYEFGNLRTTDPEGAQMLRGYRVYKANGQQNSVNSVATYDQLKSGAVMDLTPYGSNKNWPTTNPDGIAAWKQVGQFDLKYKTKLYLTPDLAIENFIGRIESNQFENESSESVIAYRAVDLMHGEIYTGQVNSNNEMIFCYMFEGTAQGA